MKGSERVDQMIIAVNVSGGEGTSTRTGRPGKRLVHHGGENKA